MPAGKRPAGASVEDNENEKADDSDVFESSLDNEDDSNASENLGERKATGSCRKCVSCATTVTPAWRRSGGAANEWLCNACSIRAKNAEQKVCLPGIDHRHFEAHEVESLVQSLSDLQIETGLRELILQQKEGRIGIGRKAFDTFADEIDQHFRIIKTGDVPKPKKLSLGNLDDWCKWLRANVIGVDEKDVELCTKRLVYAVVRTVCDALKRKVGQAEEIVFQGIAACVPTSSYYVLQKVVDMKLPPKSKVEELIGVQVSNGAWSAVLKVKCCTSWDEFPKGFGVTVLKSGHVVFELRAKSRTEALAYRECLIDKLMHEGLESNLDRNVPNVNCAEVPSKEEWEAAATRVGALFDRISTRAQDMRENDVDEDDDDDNKDDDDDDKDDDGDVGNNNKVEDGAIISYETRPSITQYKRLLEGVAGSNARLHYIPGSPKCVVVGLQPLTALRKCCHVECRGYIYVHMIPIKYGPAKSRPYAVFANKIGMTQATAAHCTQVDRLIERKLGVRGARIPVVRQEHLRDKLEDGAAIAVIFSEQSVHYFEQYLREHGEAHLRAVYERDFERVRYDGPVSKFYSETRHHGEQLELHTDYEEALRMNQVFVHAVLREVDRLRETALLFHMGTIALRRATRVPKAQIHNVVENVVSRSELNCDFKD